MAVCSQILGGPTGLGIGSTSGSLRSVLRLEGLRGTLHLRLPGFTNIAKATRWHRDDFTRPLTTLNLTM
jgi:hypothetical protein